MCSESSSTNHKKANPQKIADAIRMLFEPWQELPAPRVGSTRSTSAHSNKHKKLAQKLTKCVAIADVTEILTIQIISVWGSCQRFWGRVFLYPTCPTFLTDEIERLQTP
jgi:hypothetical protein